jgi:hypothetical protein
MAGFLNGIANFAANGGAFFPPSLLLNGGVPPAGGFPPQTVNGDVQFNDDVITNGYLFSNLIGVQNIAYKTDINDPVILSGSLTPFTESSRRAIKLDLFIPPPAPPAPPPVTFDTQILESVNTYKGVFTITNVPLEVKFILPSITNISAYEYAGQAPVTAPLPYFTTSIFTGIDPLVPTSFVLTVTACYHPPELRAGVVPPALPDSIYGIMAIDSNYW